ncbi:MAG: hypothetical protein R2710_11455 [Acidimicrobiales bacterium]
MAATKAERRHVRTPRRLLVNHLREAPTRITESLLSGVKVGPVVDALEADPATSAKG